MLLAGRAASDAQGIPLKDRGKRCPKDHWITAGIAKEQSDMEDNSWQNLFENWPRNFPRQGVLVTDFQETIPFNDFRVNEGILLLQRERPDTIGARKMMVSFRAIVGLKLTGVEELDVYDAMGFQ